MYVQGYLQGSENGRVVTIDGVGVTHKIVREPVINNHSEVISRTSLGFSIPLLSLRETKFLIP